MPCFYGFMVLLETIMFLLINHKLWWQPWKTFFTPLQKNIFFLLLLFILRTNCKYKLQIQIQRWLCNTNRGAPHYQGWLVKVYVLQWRENQHWIADKKSENFFVQISMGTPRKRDHQSITESRRSWWWWSLMMITDDDDHIS